MKWYDWLANTPKLCSIFSSIIIKWQEIFKWKIIRPQFVAENVARIGWLSSLFKLNFAVSLQSCDTSYRIIARLLFLTVFLVQWTAWLDLRGISLHVSCGILHWAFTTVVSKLGEELIFNKSLPIVLKPEQLFFCVNSIQ